MSGGSSSAQRQAQAQAEQQERERQARIAAGTNRVNSIYDAPAREAQINDLYGATRQFLTDDLNRQHANTNRQTKFALARSGHTGGSVSVDTNRRIGEDFLRGTVEADRRAQGAAADLRSQDEQARLNLLGMVQGGLDATTAGSQAAASLQNNLLTARAASTAQGLGDIFGGFTDVFRRSQETAAERRGYRDFYNLLYQPGFGYGGSRT